MGYITAMEPLADECIRSEEDSGGECGRCLILNSCFHLIRPYVLFVTETVLFDCSETEWPTRNRGLATNQAHERRWMNEHPSPTTKRETGNGLVGSQCTGNQLNDVNVYFS
jgi:hypothetical protein